MKFVRILLHRRTKKITSEKNDNIEIRLCTYVSLLEKGKVHERFVIFSKFCSSMKCDAIDYGPCVHMMFERFSQIYHMWPIFTCRKINTSFYPFRWPFFLEKSSKKTEKQKSNQNELKQKIVWSSCSRNIMKWNGNERLRRLPKALNFVWKIAIFASMNLHAKHSNIRLNVAMMNGADIFFNAKWVPNPSNHMIYFFRVEKCSKRHFYFINVLQ